MRKFLASLNSSDKIAGIALLVSAAGALVAWNTSERDAEFRRLSSLPSVKIHFVDGSNPDLTGIVLRNTGLGPARIVNLRVYVAGKFIAEMPSDKDWKRIIAEVAKARPEAHLDVPIRFSSSYGDFSIPAGEWQPLFYQKNTELTVSSLPFLRAAGDALQFGICMCSIYEKCWNVRSPGLKEEPCNAVAEYLLSNTGPVAEALKDVPRSMTPWKR